MTKRQDSAGAQDPQGGRDRASLKRELQALGNAELGAYLEQALTEAAPDDLPALLDAIREALEDPGRGRDAAWAGAALRVTLGLSHSESLDDVLALYGSAREAYSSCGHEAGIALCDEWTAEVFLDLGRHEDALALYASARQVFAGLGRDAEVAKCDMNRANALQELGMLEEATTLYASSCEVFSRLGMEDQVARCGVDHADALVDLGRYEDALALYTSTRDVYSSLGIDSGVAKCGREAADVHRKLGHHEQALSLYSSARDAYARLGMDAWVATCDLFRADMLCHLGSHEDALALYASARELYAGLGRDSDAAWCDSQRAIALGDLGRHDMALALHTSTRDLFARLGEDAHVAMCEVHRGYEFLDLGRQQEALAVYESLRDVYECPVEEDDRPERGLFLTFAKMLQVITRYESEREPLEGQLEALGVAGCNLISARELLRNGCPEGALPLLESTRDAFRRFGMEANATGISELIAIVLADLRDREVFAPVISRLGGEPEVARSELKRADALSKYGRHEDALALYTSTREVFARLGMEADMARCDMNTANALHALGRHEDALALYASAREMFARVGMETDVARCDGNSAITHRHLGHYGDALTLFSSAWEFFTSVGSEEEAVRCDLNRANVLADIGRHEDALALYESAREVFARLGVESDVAMCDLNTANVHRKLGHYEEARELYTSARHVFSDLGIQRGVFLCTFNRAHVLSSIGRHQAALAAFESASGTASRLGDLSDLASAHYGLALAHSALGDEDAALEAYVSACDSLEGALERAGGGEIDQAGFRERLPDPYTPAVSILLARAVKAPTDAERTALLTGAFTLTERARSRKLREELVRSLSAHGVDLSSLDPELSARWRAVVAEISALDRRLRDPEARGVRSEAEELEGQQERRSALLTDLASLEDELFRADPESGGIVTGRLPEVSEILAALAPEEVLVAYFPLQDDLAVFLATREGVQYAVRAEGGMAALSSPLHSLLERAERGAQDEDGWEADLVSLGTVLLSSLVEAGVFSSAERLTIVPAAELHAVPFSALRVPGDGRYLVELLPVSVAPQAATRSYQRNKVATGTRRVAVVDPDATLSWGAAEFLSLAPHTDVGYFRDQKGPVDAERFGEIASTASVLHIACHGAFEERDPLSSALFLGPPGSPEPVTVRRLYGLSARLSLVVANACETGKGRVYAGDAHLGLSRALLYLARHVVGTLWRVDDRAAAFFAKAFHTALEEGLNPVEATASAQRQMIAESALSHPAHWAAYRVMG